MNTFRRLILQYPLRFLLILLAFIIQLLPNLISSWLEKMVGEGPTQILRVIAFLAAVALVIYVVVKLVERISTSKAILVTREQQPPKFKGLLLLIGPGKQDGDPLKGPAIPAIEFHHPEVLWLLPSQAGVSFAEEIRKKFESDKCRVISRVIDNPWDVQDTYREVRNIFKSEPIEKGLQLGDLMADITGGTHPMAAGMVLACGDQINMQYMSGKTGSESRPIWIRFQPEQAGMILPEAEETI